jgi:ceramide glucosyltransferase
MSLVSLLLLLLGLLMLLERAWKHWMVVRFFQRPVPTMSETPTLVSIIQPVLSGDPTLSFCLEQNLRFQSSYPLEYIWIADDDDSEGQRICQELMQQHPEQMVRLITLPPPPERHNPKLVKVIAAAALARGDIICILDDDTQLPDGGLERCLPYLEQPGVGLAFGLPYYVSFSTFWSKLTAYFVDSTSLLTYIPYTTLTQPFTINGMFYAIKSSVLASIGGFAGLETTLADDFAVAQRFRSHGYRLAQTPLCHAISTTVRGPEQYLSLMKRWFIAPRESILRHVSHKDRLIVYGLGLVPALFPLALLLWLLAQPSLWTALYALLYVGYNYAIFGSLNRRYLHSAAPWQTSWLVPVLQVIFPIQLLFALFSPQRINWRGNIIQIERGGSFHYVQHRPAKASPAKKTRPSQA